MNYKKLVNELDNLLDLATKEQNKHKKVLEHYLQKITAKEKVLRRELESEKKRSARGKLNKELGMVKTGYELLNYKI